MVVSLRLTGGDASSLRTDQINQVGTAMQSFLDTATNTAATVQVGTVSHVVVGTVQVFGISGGTWSAIDSTVFCRAASAVTRVPQSQCAVVSTSQRRRAILQVKTIVDYELRAATTVQAAEATAAMNTAVGNGSFQNQLKKQGLLGASSAVAVRAAAIEGVRAEFGLLSSSRSNAAAAASALASGVTSGAVKANIEKVGVLLGSVALPPGGGVVGVPPPPPTSPPPPPLVKPPSPPPPKTNALITALTTKAASGGGSSNNVNVGAAVGGTFAACVVLGAIGVGIYLTMRNITRDQVEIARTLSPPTSPEGAVGASPVHHLAHGDYGDERHGAPIMYGGMRNPNSVI